MLERWKNVVNFRFGIFFPPSRGFVGVSVDKFTCIVYRDFCWLAHVWIFILIAETGE